MCNVFLEKISQVLFIEKFINENIIKIVYSLYFLSIIFLDIDNEIDLLFFVILSILLIPYGTRNYLKLIYANFDKKYTKYINSINCFILILYIFVLISIIFILLNSFIPTF